MKTKFGIKIKFEIPIILEIFKIHKLNEQIQKKYSQIAQTELIDFANVYNLETKLPQ